MFALTSARSLVTGTRTNAAFADFIARDQYPTIDLVPSDPKFGSLPELSFAEMSGWNYKFSISSQSRAFRALTFKVGSVLVANSSRWDWNAR